MNGFAPTPFTPKLWHVSPSLCFFVDNKLVHEESCYIPRFGHWFIGEMSLRGLFLDVSWTKSIARGSVFDVLSSWSLIDTLDIRTCRTDCVDAPSMRRAFFVYSVLVRCIRMLKCGFWH